MSAVSTGLVIFAHGSSIESANEPVREAARQVGRAQGSTLVEAAFLELAVPGLAEAVDALVRRGAKRIVVIPYFLTLGVHLQRDLPAIAAGIAARHQNVPIEVTAPMEGHPALIEILLERARDVSP